MGRINKIINGGFRHIINKKEDKIALFITEVTKNLADNDDESREYIKSYEELTNNIKSDLLFLSCLEELILQKTNYSILFYEKDYSGISLTVNNGYLYARHPFFRNVGENNDIRVIMGKVKDFNQSIDELKSDNVFIENCSIKLINSMFITIEKTKNEIIKYSGINNEILNR